MNLCCWIRAFGEALEQDQHVLTDALGKRGVKVQSLRQGESGRLGLCLFSKTTQELREYVQIASRGGVDCVIGIFAAEDSPDRAKHWELLQAGVSDVLTLKDPERVSQQILARFERWLCVERLLNAPTVTDLVIAKSPAWREKLRAIVEMARFSDVSILIQGESGTGKEVVAQLIHLLDSRPNKRDLVILDCSTIVPELSGSEFFGHERGAFTGALTERQGAFALANGGTLFLDEIGELPLPMQAQLLRVIQEHTYKRVGGNTWHRTAFRLICATNRDLWDMVRRGTFRGDLYYRIAGCLCRLPPLRERLEDILPLAEHFLCQASPDGKAPELEDAVRDYLLKREYPGNVRDLQQVVARLMYRCASDRTISIGHIPPEERSAPGSGETVWFDSQFEHVIQRALLLGAGLKDISRAAEEAAIRFVTNEEGGSLQRAARRLGITDRALQLRRANRRQIPVTMEPVGNGMTPRWVPDDTADMTCV